MSLEDNIKIESQSSLQQTRSFLRKSFLGHVVGASLALLSALNYANATTNPCSGSSENMPICHNGTNNICIAPSALNSHLRHGDYLGGCRNSDNDGDGISIAQGDCDDFNASVWRTLNAYLDNDNDSFGSVSLRKVCGGASLPSGYVSNNLDCNDRNNLINPNAPEVCNDRIDNNCNNLIDEGANSTFYLDNDGDGVGNSSQSIIACSAPPRYIAVADICSANDCDDNNASTWQNLPAYYDHDNDGFGAGSIVIVCAGNSLPAWYALNNVDCNDNTAAVHPGVFEWCDYLDNNCIDGVDEGYALGTSCSVGVGACVSEGTTVCSENQLETICDAVAGAPSAEVCDGADNDCDGSIDGDDVCCTINSLKGYWSFNELDGTVAYDGSGNENNGTILGGAAREGGIVGNALRFDGSDDSVIIPYHPSLNLGSESFSLSFWMYGGRNKQGIMDSYSNGKGFLIQTDSVNMDIVFCDNSSACINAGIVNIPTGNWHHYAIVFNRETGKVNRYLDASSLGDITSTIGLINQTSDFKIGDRRTTPANYAGKLDEIKIYSCALSPDLVLKEFERR